ncbi:MAG: hypothetical protein JM58_14640 [Peptococcaceae bacterium BICA1-8]|nr:MAG: hypothetical protein JM58_14640 [Peptococcaceae bacterium BICA1-8]
MATIINIQNVEGQVVKDFGAAGLEYKALFGAEPERQLHANYVTVNSGGITKNHTHEWEQVNFILQGEGILVINDQISKTLEVGMAVHIPGGEKHFYKNPGSEPLVILGVLGPMLESGKKE